MCISLGLLKLLLLLFKDHKGSTEQSKKKCEHQVHALLTGYFCKWIIIFLHVMLLTQILDKGRPATEEERLLVEVVTADSASIGSTLKTLLQRGENKCLRHMKFTLEVIFSLVTL